MGNTGTAARRGADATQAGDLVCARLDDPDGLARAALVLMDLAAETLYREGSARGRSGSEAREDAITWLTGQVRAAELRLLESGAVYDPHTAVLGLQPQEDATAP